MRKPISPMLVSGLFLAIGCREEPRLYGHSLECSSDAHCAKIAPDWRCFQDVCIKNAGPFLQEPSDILVTLSDPPVAQTQQAVATDLEGDPITIVWRGINEPAKALLAQGLSSTTQVEGASLTVTPAAMGIYEFEVFAHDQYPGSESEHLRFAVVVQPIEDVVYVSQLGSDTDECGTWDLPCQSIAKGAAVASQRPIPKILLAAVAGFYPYEECLDLGGNVSISGCYDPETWVYDPRLHRRCRVECDQPDGTILDLDHPTQRDVGGHHLQGAVALQNLVLAMADFVQPVNNTLSVDPQDQFPVVTVWIDEGTPSLIDVDVEIADCLEPTDTSTAAACSTHGLAGLASIHASPQLSGVNLYGRVTGFEPVAFYFGMLFIGGKPQVRDTISGSGVQRGDVLLNRATNEAAVGVILVATDATVSGLRVRGGPAPTLVGASVYEGNAVLDHVDIDLTGFGTQVMYGVITSGCNFSSSGPEACTCKDFYPDCPSPEPALSTAPSTTIVNSTITLQGANTATKIRPCSGVGVYGIVARVDEVSPGTYATTAVSHTISDNQIEIGRDFTMGVGVLLGAPDHFTEVGEAVLAGNELTIDEAKVNDVCMFQNRQQGATDSGAMTAGVFLLPGVSADVHGNTMAIGANEEDTIGVSGWKSDVLHIVDNDVVVGSQTVLGQSATGILLQTVGVTDTTPGTLSHNRVRIDANIVSGTAVALGGPPYWNILNNFLVGGHSYHSTGLVMNLDVPDVDWPRIQHNTIMGGWDEAHTLTSRALAASFDNKGTLMPLSTGLLQNNLLDAGMAVGRRVLLENWGNGFFKTMSDNHAQFQGEAHGARPTVALAPDEAGEYVRFLTLLEGNNELAVLQEGPTGIWMPATEMVPGPVQSVWTGHLDPVSNWLLVAVPPWGIAISKTTGADPVPFEIHETVTADGSRLTPTHVSAGLLNADPIADLVLAAKTPGQAGTWHGIWVMYGRPNGGFDAARLVTGLPAAPTALDVVSEHRRGLVAIGDDVFMFDTSGLPPSFFITAAEPTSILKVTSFLEESGSDVAQSDLVVVGGGRAWVFLNPFDAPVPQPVSMSTSCPCCAEVPSYGDSVVTAVAVGPVYPEQRRRELIVGCGDGRIDIRAYIGAAMVRVGLAAPAVPSAVSGLAIPLDSSINNPLQLPFVATYGLVDQVVTFQVHQTSGAIAQRHTYTFLSDVAWRDRDYQLQPAFVGTGAPSADMISLSGPGVDRYCQFAACGDPPPPTCNPYDLHLVAGTGCIDEGGAVGVTDDIDGGMRDNEPDTGADEFSSP